MADKRSTSGDVTDEIQGSLDELSRLSENLVDGLADVDEPAEETPSAVQKPETDRAAALRETLKELDRLGGPETSRAAKIFIGAGQDRGLDIDDCLDALFDEATATPDTPIETNREAERDDPPAPESILVDEVCEVVEAVSEPTEQRAILPESLFDAPIPADFEPPRERKGSRARTAFLAVVLLAVAAATWLLIPRRTSVKPTVDELALPRSHAPAALRPQPTASAAPATEMPAPAKKVPAPVVAAPTPKAPPSAKPKKNPPPRETSRAAADLPAREIVAPAATPDSSRPVEAAAAPESDGAVAAPQVEAPRVEAPRVEAPQIVTRVEPVYSPHARARDERGTVVLSVLVNERGQVVRVVVENGIPNSDLDAAAIDAVLRWRYRPGTENGRPVRAWVTESFSFGP